MKKWVFYFLFGIPLITLFLNFTNEFHYWYYAGTGLQPDAPFPVADLTPGIGFYIHSFYLYVCLAASILILVIQFKKTHKKFRLQILMMIMGLLTPVTASFIYILGLSPYGIDIGPVSMSVSFLFHFAALVSLQMFNVVPIARDAVFESMKQGVIVLDTNHLVVDFNEAVIPMVPRLSNKTIGSSIFMLLEKIKS